MRGDADTNYSVPSKTKYQQNMLFPANWELLNWALFHFILMVRIVSLLSRRAYSPGATNGRIRGIYLFFRIYFVSAYFISSLIKASRYYL